MRYSFNFVRCGVLCLALAAMTGCSEEAASGPRVGGSGGDGGDGGAGGVFNPDCGDGVLEITEACDDGNAEDGDGCAGNCYAVEPGYRCPIVGADCIPIVCGDSRIDPPETCDDGHDQPGDGCSASCVRQDGWSCPIPGVACVATACGDGFVAGFEQCDDGDTEPLDGCDGECRLEDGFKCDAGGEDCEPTVCGDGQIEGTEQCDDGNATPFDGCSADCKNEPVCDAGECDDVCGDAVILPNSEEACDDGNTEDGDGCSSTCEVEGGFTCDLSEVELGETLTIPVLYRDFRSNDTNDPTPTDFSPDFNNPDDSNGGIAFDITADQLVGGKPVLSGENEYVYGSNEGPPHSAESFSHWYSTTPQDELGPTGNLEVVGELVLSEQPNGSYRFSSNDDPQGFFPLDDPELAPLTWPEDDTYPETRFVPTPRPNQDPGPERNFGFTTEVHYFFVYQGDEVLTFSGDDDLWVFVDGFLCLDVGGLHPEVEDVMSFADPTDANSGTQDAIVATCKARLTEGEIYEMAIFHAERHTGASNFSLTLNGFVTRTSSCEWDCGDGVVTRFERCDDGEEENTGEYGHCLPTCLGLGPYCGDGILDEEYEECDLGDNLGALNGCNPDCTLGPTCGDGVRQPDLGEECDAGQDNGEPGSGCDTECRIEVQ